jgi:hypothetical protein
MTVHHSPQSCLATDLWPCSMQGCRRGLHSGTQLTLRSAGGGHPHLVGRRGVAAVAGGGQGWHLPPHSRHLPGKGESPGQYTQMVPLCPRTTLPAPIRAGFADSMHSSLLSSHASKPCRWAPSSRCGRSRSSPGAARRAATGCSPRASTSWTPSWSTEVAPVAAECDSRSWFVMVDLKAAAFGVS